jgi:response regulator of citrate/malate metabolism
MEKTNIKGTVIIVEDDMLLSLVEERIVEKLGFNVIAKAVSGEEAIIKIKKYQPDVVVMDISLKGDIDGIETVGRIRSFTNVPVIYISGNTDKQHIARAKKTGFVAFLVKPLSHNDMVLPMEKAIQQSGEYKRTIHREKFKKSEDYAATSYGQ